MDVAVDAELVCRRDGARRLSTLKKEDNEDMSCTSEKTLYSSSPRRLLAGSLLLVIVLLLCLTAAMLSYYFQVRSHLRVAEGEVQTLRTNSCHLQDEMEMTQEYVSQLQRNLSSVLQEYRHLHDTLIPGLRYNQNQHQGALQVIERQRQQQRSKRSKLEEQYRNFLKGNVLIPRTSDLLMDCAAADQDLAMLCPFCPPRWRIYELSCYLQSEEAQNWEESLSWCRERGGFLAVVNDEEEQNFLEGFVNVTAWIGLSDHHREGNWRWVDGTPYESTTWVWGPEQPNNDGDEDCVTLSPASQWSDEECSEKYTSVCERRADQLSLKGVILSN